MHDPNCVSRGQCVCNLDSVFQDIADSRLLIPDQFVKSFPGHALHGDVLAVSQKQLRRVPGDAGCKQTMESTNFHGPPLPFATPLLPVLNCADERQKENLDAEKSRAQEVDTNQSNETC